MRALVDNASTEISWHGLVEPYEDTVRIYDVLVYPQVATAVTVEADDDNNAYVSWLDDLPDAQFNQVRMQGHSHVNMGTSPSGTDINFYETLLEHVKDFYIFMILNKAGSVFVEYYDIANNVVYETADIELVKEIQGFDYRAWYNEQSQRYVTLRTSFSYKPATATKTKGKSKSSHFVQDHLDDDSYWNHYNRSGGSY
jgi:hypothetical protein